MLGDQHRVRPSYAAGRGRGSARRRRSRRRGRGACSGSALRCSTNIVSSRLTTPCTRVAAEHAWWIRSRGRRPGGRAPGRQSWSPCRRRRSPRPPRPGRRRSRPARASMSATAASISSFVGGSPARWRSFSRTEPMSSDCAASTMAVVGAEDQLGGAAADVEHQQRLGQPAAGPGRPGEATAAPPRRRSSTSGCDADPFLDAGDELLGVLGVAGGRGRAEPDRLDVVLARRSRHVLLDRGEHPLQRGLRDPPGAVDALAEPDDAHLADEVDARAGVGVEVGDEQPEASWCRSRRRRPGSWLPLRRTGRHARAARPPVAQPVEHLVTERVHAAALGQRLAGEHVQALHPVGHASGRDAGDLRAPRRSRARAPR